MGKGSDNKQQPHAVIVPGPFQSHIKAMLSFAKLLHKKGFHITFVNTEFNDHRLLKSRGPNALDGLHDFQFVSISDTLPPSEHVDQTQAGEDLLDPVRNLMLRPFLNLIANLNASTVAPPVTCIISDGFMIFTVHAKKILRIPIVVFMCLSACSFLGLRYHHALVEKGLTPLKDESYLTNGYLETVVDFIPGMEGIRLRDLQTYIRTTDPDDKSCEFVIKSAADTSEASAVIFHTFDALEHKVLATHSTTLAAVYAIGPLPLLVRQIDKDDDLNKIGANLWKEEPKCIEWLDSRDPNTVIYINCGSVATMTKDQLTEFAIGVANSNQYFLWIIRPDLVRGETAILPIDFEEKTKGRGFIASWCAQEDVLNHPSVGGFLTHCGWNSVLESLSAGVPIICMPFFGDQPMNCRYSCNEWEMGLEISVGANRDEVEEAIRELMEADKGKKMKEKAMEWKQKAEMATSCNGSSSINLDKVINEVLLSQTS